ncbi:hypothetical protein [uncultured Flavobacterium sp.]|uniref:hypothetical protein n=1 Tax=uncultured Flavobacterium sp. TaxID=165435 RepID=UPI0030EDD531|tara:strand:- start:194384 stop:194833 length:450 start_codon:yes stop_codon:yes gene_type:complete
MNKLKVTTIVLLAFFLFSCNDKAKNETTELNQTTETEVHNHSDDEAIQLDGDKKWKVDDNMMAHIRNMEKDVTSFDKEKPETYQVLADNLKENLDLLTSNCTMKGQAHDELHKWLLPYIDLVDNFSEGKSKEQFTEIQHSFTTFNQYFE